MLVDDLAALERLTEEVIVTQLQRRYRAGQIYTHIGDILIAVNPFSHLSIYGEKVRDVTKRGWQIIHGWRHEGGFSMCCRGVDFGTQGRYQPYMCPRCWRAITRTSYDMHCMIQTDAASIPTGLACG